MKSVELDCSKWNWVSGSAKNKSKKQIKYRQSSAHTRVPLGFKRIHSHDKCIPELNSAQRCCYLEAAQILNISYCMCRLYLQIRYMLQSQSQISIWKTGGFSYFP